MDSDRPAGQHRRRFTVLSALRWFPIGLVIPVLVLHLGARGLALGQVGLLLSVYGVTTLLLELPTGGLADVIGARAVIAASALATAAGFTGLAVATHPAALAGFLAVMGLGRALSSGPLAAWYVEGARALDPDHPIDRGLAGAGAAESLAIGLGALLGGLIPGRTGLPGEGSTLIATSVPFLLAAALTLVVGALAWPWLAPSSGTEALRTGAAGATASGVIRETVSETRRTVRDGLRLAGQTPILRRLIAVALILGVLLGGVELLSPGVFADLAGGTAEGAAVYGVLAALGFAAAAGGAISGPWLRRGRATRSRVSAAAYAVAAVSVLALASPVLALAAGGYLVVYVCVGIQGPHTATLLHDEVPDSTRATMLSMESLAMQAGGVVANVGVGALAAQSGVGVGLAVLSAAALAAAALLVRARPTANAADAGSAAQAS